jgi:hypothetical protein
MDLSRHDDLVRDKISTASFGISGVGRSGLGLASSTESVDVDGNRGFRVLGSISPDLLLLAVGFGESLASGTGFAEAVELEANGDGNERRAIVPGAVESVDSAWSGDFSAGPVDHLKSGINTRIGGGSCWCGESSGAGC